jgi:dihydropyrimidinase
MLRDTESLTSCSRSIRRSRRIETFCTSALIRSTPENGLMRTLVSNGAIVTADGSYAADVLVDGETIVQIGAGLATGGGVTADETIDAAGKYVIPGGIDVHAHGAAVRRDVREGRSRRGRRRRPRRRRRSLTSRSVEGKSLREGLDAWHAKAEATRSPTTAST